MKATIFRSRMVLAIAAVAGLSALNAASAENAYLEQNGYEEEMNRCIDLLRPALQSVRFGKVIYDVQEINLRGPWYQFEISITVKDTLGATRLDSYKVGCKSNRWIALSELEDRPNSLQLPIEMALLASK